MTRVARHGVTIIELLVALALLTIVGGGLATAISIQWRSHDELVEEQRSRQATGDGADLLLAELRPLSPAAGDIEIALDTALQVRATLGASVICSLSVGRDRIVVPPRRPATGAALTWWRDMPAAGDSIDVFDGRGSGPDSLSRHQIVSMSGGRCPSASGFVRSAADAASGLQFDLSPPLPPSIGAGAPVRFMRSTRYSLYRSSVDNRWYLGVKELLGGRWTIIQPVTGPFVPPAAGGAGGIAIRLSDGTGTVVAASPYDVARVVEIALRARSTRPPRALGRRVPVAESLQVTVSPRNE